MLSDRNSPAILFRWGTKALFRRQKYRFVKTKSKRVRAIIRAYHTWNSFALLTCISLPENHWITWKFLKLQNIKKENFTTIIMMQSIKIQKTANYFAKGEVNAYAHVLYIWMTILKEGLLISGTSVFLPFSHFFFTFVCTGVFRKINMDIQPRQGRAVIFFPAFLSGGVDTDTLHCAQKVIKSTKYVSQVWIRQSYREDGQPSPALAQPTMS